MDPECHGTPRIWVLAQVVQKVNKVFVWNRSLGNPPRRANGLLQPMARHTARVWSVVMILF